MIQHIFAAILCVIAAAAGIWDWRLENGGSFESKKKKEQTKKEIGKE